MKILVLSDPGSGVFYYRFKLFLRDWEVRKGVQWELFEIIKNDDLKLYKPDVVFFSQLVGEANKLVALIHAENVAVYYDLDDYPFVLNDFHIINGVELILGDNVFPFLLHADLVSLSTMFLRDAVLDYFANNLGASRDEVWKKLEERVFIRPNYVDISDFHPKIENKSGRVRIGYSAAIYHLVDLLVALDALIELDKKYDIELHLYGFDIKFYDWQRFIVNWLKKLGVDDVNSVSLQDVKNTYVYYLVQLLMKLKQLKYVYAHPWVPITEHFYKLSRLGFDIGIAPLRDTLFNKCKTALKFYEYAMAGIPTVASNIEPYKGECNYLADNTFEDWYNRLEQLIVDKDFRYEIWKAQREWVLENRVFNEKVSDEFFDRLAAAVERRRNVK